MSPRCSSCLATAISCLLLLAVSAPAFGAKPAKGAEVKITPRDDAEANLDKATKSSNFEVRGMACEGLAYLRDKKKALEILKDAAKDPQWVVRRGVVLAYITLKSAEYKPLLQSALADPGIPSKEILGVLDLLKEADAQAIFFAVVGDKDVAHRDRILDALVLRNGSSLGGLLRAGLANKNEIIATATRKAVEKLRADMHGAALLEIAKAAKDDAALAPLVAVGEAAAPEVKIPFLKGLKATDPALQLRLLSVLATHGEKSVAGKLVELVKSTKDEPQLQALRALKFVASKAEAAHLKPLLKSPTPDVLYAVAEVLAQVGDSSMEARFKELADGTDASLRPAAVYFLGRLGGVSALEKLHNYLKDGSPGVRREASRALAFIATAVSVPPLKDAIDEERDQDVRVELIRAMAAIRTKEAVEAIQFYSREKDVRIRRIVTKALAESRDSVAGQGLASAQNDQDTEVRVMAIRGFIVSDPARSVDVWRRALAWLPQGTILAFTRELNKDMLGYIEMALVAEREDIRDEAIEALRLLPKEEPELLKKVMATAKDEALRVRLLERIVTVQGQDAATDVKALALAGEPKLRVAAVRLLRKLKDKESAEILAKLLLDPDERVRVAAALTYVSTSGK